MPQIKMPENMGGRDFIRVDEVTNKANCNIGSIRIRLWNGLSYLEKWEETFLDNQGRRRLLAEYYCHRHHERRIGSFLDEIAQQIKQNKKRSFKDSNQGRDDAKQQKFSQLSQLEASQSKGDKKPWRFKNAVCPIIKAKHEYIYDRTLGGDHKAHDDKVMQLAFAINSLLDSSAYPHNSVQGFLRWMGVSRSAVDSYLNLNLICSRPVAVGIYDFNNEKGKKIYEWLGLKYKGKIFANEIEAMAQRIVSFQDKILEMTESTSIVVAVMKCGTVNMSTVSTEYYALKYDIVNNVLFHEDVNHCMFRLDQWEAENPKATMLKHLLAGTCDIGVFQLEKTHQTVSQADEYAEYNESQWSKRSQSSNSASHFIGILLDETNQAEYKEETDPYVHESLVWNHNNLDRRSEAEAKALYDWRGIKSGMNLKTYTQPQTK